MLLAPQATRVLDQGFAWEFARNPRQIAALLDTMPPYTVFDPHALGLCAFSICCTMGLWLLAHQPARFGFFAAFGMGSAFDPWELDDGGVPLDNLRAAAATPPILLAVDQQDPAGCARYLAANLAVLRDLGFHVTTFTTLESRHWVTAAMGEHFQAWLRALS